jgi:photosystem II stability/assembly factor-like uncharacterized protein
MLIQRVIFAVTLSLLLPYAEALDPLCKSEGPVASVVDLGLIGDHIFAVGYSRLYPAAASLFSSVDGGKHWVRHHDFNDAPNSIQHLRVFNGHLFVVAFSGVDQSEDEGVTWHTIPTPAGLVIRDFAESGSRWLLATTVGLYLSDDRGLNWTQIHAGLNGPAEMRLLGVGADVVLIANGDGWLFRSTDRGVTWNRVTLPYNEGSWRSSAFQFLFDRSHPRHVFYAQGMGLFVSTDDGVTWFRSIPENRIAAVDAIIQLSSRLYALGTLPATTMEKIYVSHDEGSTWDEVPSPPSIPYLSHLSSASTDATAFLAPDIRIYSTSNFTSYGFVDSGISNSPVSILAAVDGRLVAGLGDGRINSDSALFSSSDSGKSWSSLNFPNSFIADVAGGGGALFIATREKGLFRRMGAKWEQVGGSIGSAPTAIAVAPNAPAVLYAGTTELGVFKSTDGGNTWFRVSVGLPSKSVTVVNVDPQNADTVLCGFESGGGVYMTENGGASWRRLNMALPEPYFVQVIRRESNSGAIYVGTTTGLRVTFDKGNTWIGLDSGLSAPSLPVRDIAVHKQVAVTILRVDFVGRLYQSSDGGLSWILRYPERVPATVSNIVLEPEKHLLHIGYWGYGVCTIEMQ